jgi:hypothetical protein
LPVPAAVGLGIALSLLLQLNQEALDLKVVRLEVREDGALVESEVPQRLHSGDVVILEIYGSPSLPARAPCRHCCPIPPTQGARRSSRTPLGNSRAE